MLIFQPHPYSLYSGLCVLSSHFCFFFFSDSKGEVQLKAVTSRKRKIANERGTSRDQGTVTYIHFKYRLGVGQCREWLTFQWLRISYKVNSFLKMVFTIPLYFRDSWGNSAAREFFLASKFKTKFTLYLL